MTTYEGSWRVQDAKDALHPFQRDKLLMSIHKSLEHRPKSVVDASGITATVMALLQHQTSQGLLETSDIAITVHEVLQNFDKAAAVHYAAFHNL
jgi:transcriptional regulator NrdR family protein